MLYRRALDEWKIAEFRDVCLSTDTPNANGRIYPKSAVVAAVAKVQGAIKERRFYGGFISDKGEEGWTTTGASMGKFSHVITDLHLDENGDLIATVEILDTPNGKLAVALLQEKAVGLFTRGIGHCERDLETGHDVIQPDFELQSIDFCPLEKKTWPQHVLSSAQEMPALKGSTD